MKAKASYLFASMALVLLAVSLMAFLRYNGTAGPFLLFDAVFLLLLSSAFLKPRLFVYTFLSLFLFLGFWVKFMHHTIVGHAYVEPIGSFDGTGESWDRVLLVASCGAIGVILARGLHLLYSRRISPERTTASSAANIPVWYLRYKKPLWVSTVFFLLVLSSLNATTGFNQTGLCARVILPLHLNLIATWLVNIGLAFWIAMLIDWESRAGDRRGFQRALLMPIVEGLISGVVMLSRRLYLFHSVPYIFVLFERRAELRPLLRGRYIKILMVLFVFAFLFSLAGVSVFRLYTYPTLATQVSSPEGATLILVYAKEILSLPTNRWIGLEGVLAVSSHSEVGWDLLTRGLREDPSTGINSIYQTISGARAMYGGSENTCFATLPGTVAVLYYSGSLLVVGFGMLFLTLLTNATEIVSLRFIGNPFLASLSGMAMAIAISDLSSPYLSTVFFFQLFVSLFCIWFVQTVSPSFRVRPFRVRSIAPPSGHDTLHTTSTSQGFRKLKRRSAKDAKASPAALLQKDLLAYGDLEGAEDCAEAFRLVAKQRLGLDLNYEPIELPLVEDRLLAALGQQTESDTHVQNLNVLARALGCYVGETLRYHVISQSSWRPTGDRGEERLIEFPDAIADPLGKASAFLRNGPEDSVAYYVAYALKELNR